MPPIGLIRKAALSSVLGPHASSIAPSLAIVKTFASQKTMSPGGRIGHLQCKRAGRLPLKADIRGAPALSASGH